MAESNPVDLRSFMASAIAPCPGKTSRSPESISSGERIRRARAPTASHARNTLRRLPMP